MSDDESDLAPRKLIRKLSEIGNPPTSDSLISQTASATASPTLADPESHGVFISSLANMSDGFYRGGSASADAGSSSNSRGAQLPDFRISNTKPQDIRLLLSRIEVTHFPLMGFSASDDAKKIAYVVARFDDVLYNKYETVDRPETWAAFKDWLLKAYHHQGYVIHQITELMNLRQYKQPLAPFLSRFQNLANSIPSQDVSQLTLVVFLLQSLANPNLKQQLLLMNPPLSTLQEAIDAALSLAASLQNTSSPYRPPNRDPRTPRGPPGARIHNTQASTPQPDRYGKLPDEVNNKWCKKCNRWRNHTTEECNRDKDTDKNTQRKGKQPLN